MKNSLALLFLSIRSKIILLLLIMLVPLGSSLWNLSEVVQKEISFADGEIVGVQAQIPMVGLLKSIGERWISIEMGMDVVTHDSEISRNLIEAQKLIEQNPDYTGFGDRELTSAESSGFAGLNLKGAKWSDVPAAVFAAVKSLPSNKSEESYQRHKELQASVKAMISRITDKSGLTLDPDLDTFYVMDVISFAVPNTMQAIADAKADMLASIDKRANISSDLLKTMNVYEHAISSDHVARIISGIATAHANDKEAYGESKGLSEIEAMSPQLQAKLDGLMTFFAKYMDSKNEISASDVMEAYVGIEDEIRNVTNLAQKEMIHLLGVRIDDKKESKKAYLIEGVITALMGVVISLYISWSVASPINNLRRVMRLLASGDVDVVVPYQKKPHEVGEIARAVAVFKDNALHLRGLASDFEGSVMSVVNVVSSATSQLGASSVSLSKGNDASHKKLSEFASYILEIKNSMNTVSVSGQQLYASINEISQQMHKTTTINNHAIEEASKMKTYSEDLAEAARQVTGIIGLINTIASKTTLLAMNATIEATRAGEFGKGFAVVANEVKDLAGQTVSATKKINELIGAIQSSSKNTLTMVAQINKTIDELNQISGVVASAVEEQSAATRDISSHITFARDSVERMGDGVTVIMNSAQEAVTISEQNQQAVGELSKQFEILKNKVKSFMSGLVRQK